MAPIEGAAEHLVAARHPISGQEHLYTSSHADGALVDQLLDFASNERFVYTHDWSVNDLIIWDNHLVLHRVLPFEQILPRILGRAEAGDIRLTR